jgi:hypothetical protein
LHVKASLFAVSLAVLAALSMVSCGGSSDQEVQGYAPEIDPGRFSAVVDNPFFPLGRGTTFSYSTPDGDERVEIVVTDQTRDVMGVACVVVESREYEDDELVEVTLDWYAQDAGGSVWYFGEDTRAYGEDGTESSAGSWEAGVDGAEPGIIMPGAPVLGEPYRQEYYAGHAEDMGQVVRLDGSVAVPYGTFSDALVTRDWTPLEPDVSEHKYYVRDVGLVLEDEGRTRVELVRMVRSSSSTD